MGNEAVDQLSKFDRALKDFSSATSPGKGRGIDGLLVTKWDTVDDKVRLSTYYKIITVILTCVCVGRCCAIDDLCHRKADLFRWLWTGKKVNLAQYGPQTDRHFQTYTDLRQLRVSNVVQALLSE